MTYAHFRHFFQKSLDHLNQRIAHMATADQIAKLTADVETLIKTVDAYRAAVEAKAGQPDPALDTLDQTVAAKTAEIAAATPAG